MNEAAARADAPWWATDDDAAAPDPLLRVGGARVHPRTRPLVDERVSELEPTIAALIEAVESACAGLDRRPWPTFAACGSGIRTAFQPRAPDLDAKVTLFFEVDEDESRDHACAELGLRVLPRVIGALARSEALHFHRLNLPWYRPTAQQVLTSTFPELPWQSGKLWTARDVEAGELDAPEGQMVLEDGLVQSNHWSLVLGVTMPGQPVSMDVEMQLIAVDPKSRRARGLLCGLKTSTLGRAFFRERDAFGGRALEQRALRTHGLKQIASHVTSLVADARTMYLNRNYRQAAKLLIEPSVATGNRALVEPLRALVQSFAWRARVELQAWHALRAFRDGTVPPDRIATARSAVLDGFEAAAGVGSDARDTELAQGLVAFTHATREEQSEDLFPDPPVRRAILELVEARAHAMFQARPEILARWFGPESA